MEKFHQSHDKEIIPAQEIKKYLYHMVPIDMKGTILHPLNKLKEIHPELYLLKVKKYNDRKEILETFIPTLECLWNDVLHCAAIDPATLKEALVAAGREPTEMKFYQIDPEKLDPQKTTIYLFPEKTKGSKLEEGQFVNYHPSKLEHYTEIPSGTKQYYKKKYNNGEKPLLFLGIPHILHKGPLDISDAPVITV